MRLIISLFILLVVKVLARTFYRVESSWLHRPKEDPWDGIKLVVFLNHTSLYEPLFIGAIPWRVLWRLATDLVVPAADVTINRPIVGKFFKYLTIFNFFINCKYSTVLSLEQLSITINSKG